MGIGRISISSQVMARQVGEEMILLDLASGVYFGLDPVGARIWEMIAQGKRLAEVRDQLLAEYEVPADVAERDLHRLIGELAAHGLITLV
jgi:hypothetical protein